MAEMWVNMGPQHPMTHGLWNLRVKLDGEVIVDADPLIGYLHRGMEKMAEHRTYTQYAPITDRFCYASSMTWSHLYCMTIEDLFEVEVPERAEWIRVLTLELQRIASHLMWLAALGPDLGNLTLFLYAMRERELFIDLLESISGGRLLYAYQRIGGVRNPIPPGFEERCLEYLDFFEDRIPEYEDLCDNSEIFRMRMEDVGIVSAKDAINMGFSGPNLRASGVEVDLRTLAPYSVYARLDFDIPVHQAGDSFARYWVRMQEMKESCRIIRQVLPNIPTEGEFRAKVPRKPKAGATGFARVEDPRGEAAMHVISDGSQNAYRLKVRSPQYVSMSLGKHLMLGHKISDVPAVMGSIDVCMGEVDR